MLRKIIIVLVVTLATASIAFAETTGPCPPTGIAKGEYAICLSSLDNKIHVYRDNADLGVVANGSAYSSSTEVTATTPPTAEKPPEARKPHVFLLNDNMFTYEFSSWFRDPFIATYDNSGNPIKANNISKHVVTFKHVDVGNKLGDNTFVMQYLSSNHINPTSTDHFHDNMTVGAKDVYMTFRHNFGLSRLTNKDLSWGPIKDVLVTFGFDFGSKNDDFSNQRRSPMFGPGVAFKVPNHGYWNIVAMWTREWNQEGTDVTSYRYCTVISTTDCQSNPGFATGYVKPMPTTWGQPIEYDNSYTIQSSWGVPFALGKALMSFEGFAVFNGTKGYGAPELQPFTGGHVWTQKGTKPETIIRPTLYYNFGKAFGESHNWQIGVGYEYWNNLFGVDHHKYPGTLENAPFLSLNIHL